MRILHLTPSVGPQSYGLGQAALSLVKAQTALGHDSSIWCLDPAPECLRTAEAVGLSPDRIRSFRTVGRASLAISPALYNAVRIEGGGFQVIHQHGIWTAISLVTRSIASRHACPTVVAPHGSLQSFVLRKSRWKKHLASWAYEASNLQLAACLHAVAPNEFEDFRAYGLHNPIALVTNGISDGWLEQKGDGARFREAFGIPAGARILLFMSRIARKKGLPMLLEAWARVSQSASDWILVVVGADEEGHKEEVERLSARFGLSRRVRFVGPMFGRSKRDAFAAAQVFVLPSHSEGFPMVVLESLGAGVPAIVTRASAWKELETHGCGWWVDTSPEGIERALALATTLSDEKLRDMGSAGRTLVAARYNWSIVAGQTVELYQWLCGLGAQPAFVATSSG